MVNAKPWLPFVITFPIRSSVTSLRLLISPQGVTSKVEIESVSASKSNSFLKDSIEL